jgi:ATP-dependent RNA helicase RhlE
VSAFHSDLEQREREDILLSFKNKQLPIIIGTDALSRGIDVEGIDLVINYDVPGDPEDYIHRIGRTARAETTGTAITFVNHRDERKLKSIEVLIDKPIRLIDVPDELAGIQQVKHEHTPNKRPQNRRWGNKAKR